MDAHHEALTKAAHDAGFLVEDLRAAYAAAEDEAQQIVLESMLELATKMEQQLRRLVRS